MGSISYRDIGVRTEQSILDQGQFRQLGGKPGGGEGDGDLGKWETGIRIGPGRIPAFVFGWPPIGFAFVPQANQARRCRVSPHIIALFSCHCSRLSNRNCPAKQPNTGLVSLSLSGSSWEYLQTGPGAAI